VSIVHLLFECNKFNKTMTKHLYVFISIMQPTREEPTIDSCRWKGGKDKKHTW